MSKKDENNANEPLSDYGEPVSFQQVWKMFQETDKKFKETDKLLTEKFRETDKQMKATDRKIDRLAKLYGGISDNNGDVAEEFFRRGLETKTSLFGIPYDQVGKFEKRYKNLQGEYDIVLYNGDTMIIVEVKYKLHPDDVTDFANRKLPNFKPLFPEYENKQVIGAVAGMSVPTDSYELATKHGLLVLTQSGENIAVMNPEGFEPKGY